MKNRRNINLKEMLDDTTDKENDKTKDTFHLNQYSHHQELHLMQNDKEPEEDLDR